MSSSSDNEYSDSEYQAPKGFSKVKDFEETIMSENLANKELFLFRVPKGLKAADLNGITMNLKKGSTSTKFKIENRRYMLRSDKHLTKQKLYNFCSTSSGSDLALGKSFSQSFSVVETIPSPKKKKSSKKRKSSEALKA